MQGEKLDPCSQAMIGAAGPRCPEVSRLHLTLHKYSLFGLEPSNPDGYSSVTQGSELCQTRHQSAYLGHF